MSDGYVSVYLRRDQFIIESFNRSHGGPWLAGPAEVGDGQISDRELGECIMASLEKSTVTLQSAQAVTARPTPAMVAVGARSWEAFAREAVMVGVPMESKTLVLEPMEAGERNSFEPHAELAERELKEPSAEEAGRAVRELVDAIRAISR